jgi:hypothetical protein
MADAPLKAAAVGLRHGAIYTIGSDGLPEAPTWGTADVAYDGSPIDGIASFTITIPDPQIIPHIGEDRVLQVDALPTQEPITAEMMSALTDLQLDALIQNVKVQTLNEMQILPRGTSQQGLEPDLIVWAYRQSTSMEAATKGARMWQGSFLGRAVIFPKLPAGEQGGKNERNFTVQPKVVTTTPWGVALTLAANGCLETQVFDVHTYKRSHFAAWKADGIVTAFDFSTGFTPDAPTVTTSVFHFDIALGTIVDITATATTTVTEITPLVLPVAGDKIMAMYQIADTQ